jgi:hypothetical protein
MIVDFERLSHVLMSGSWADRSSRFSTTSRTARSRNSADTCATYVPRESILTDGASRRAADSAPQPQTSRATCSCARLNERCQPFIWKDFNHATLARCPPRMVPVDLAFAAISFWCRP